MKNPQEKKIRITLDLTPQFYDRLERLEKMVDADSKSNLIRQALQLYEYIANHSLQGGEFRAIDKDGRERELVFFAPVLPANPKDEDAFATMR